ncbi:MAG TPA: peptidylprolyl isomerase [Anaerolineae bacterium]|nr:peptidylprolyl isomerase [Anaerolineae bacterium]
MQIAKNTVVTIDYTLTDDQGSVLDTSKGAVPLVYMQGSGNLIPGLERALEGKSTGDQFKVSIPPEEAYGLRVDENMEDVPLSAFPGDEELEVGSQVEVQHDHGTHVMTVVAINDDSITLDANHPLAGEILNFDVRVVAVREAAAEELEHGHAHGGHGH